MIGSELICMNCKHLHTDRDDFSCDAFEDGIPEIIFDTNEHSEPIEGQENTIVFEKVKEE